ncbi:MAG: hypothetical protein C5B60_10995 [Chloroflexi bacterium]|nr:MAG: hypothetical protein C5B60_10995 [Chloroflexota bacterium]
MARYPAQPLEEKLVWMRQRQRQRQEAEARQQQKDESKFQLSEAQKKELRLWAQVKEALLEANLVIRTPSVRTPSAACEETSYERRMLRVGEVAIELGVSVRTVQRWFADRAVIVEAGPRKTTMLISRRVLDDWKKEHTSRH